MNADYYGPIPVYASTWANGAVGGAVGGSAPPGFIAQQRASTSGYGSPMELQSKVDGFGNQLGDIRERVGRVEARLDSIDRHHATKDDLSKAHLSIVLWVIGGGIAAVSLIMGTMAKGFGWL